MATPYSKDTDYKKKMDEAASAGDYTSAAVYEQQRNSKITGEGLPGVSQSNLYAKYLPDSSVITSIANMENQTPLPPAVAAQQLSQIQQERSRPTGGSGYQNPYAAHLDRLVGGMMGSAFTYDENGPEATALRESYTRNGQKAMQDTLAQVSARTGGLASSYAGVAGQQTYDGYMENLNAALMEQKEREYARYLQEQQLALSKIGVLSGLDQNAYGRFQDQRDFDYGRYLDDRGFTYQVGRDQVSDGRYDREWDYTTGQDFKNAARQEVDRILAAGGTVPKELADAAGYSQAYLDAMRANTSSAGGTRSGGRDSTTSDQVDAEFQSLQFDLDDIYTRNITNGNSTGALQYVTQKIAQWVEEGLDEQNAQKLAERYGIRLAFK